MAMPYLPLFPVDEVLLREAPRRDGGYLSVSQGPGLGVTLANDWRARLGDFARLGSHPLPVRGDGSLYSR